MNTKYTGKVLEYDGPPRTFQEAKRIIQAALAKFRATGKSRYTDGKIEWATYVHAMRTARRAWKRYARKHYPQWTHPQAMRELWAARKAFLYNANAYSLDALCHVNYNLWNMDFLDTEHEVRCGTHNLSDPFDGRRKIVEDARTLLKRWQEVKERNPLAQVGMWVDGENVSVSVDDMIEEAEEDFEEAIDSLEEATGEDYD